MKVKELMEELKKVDGDLDVAIGMLNENDVPIMTGDLCVSEDSYGGVARELSIKDFDWNEIGTDKMAPAQWNPNS